nr:unnamed protein product [Spirometra erinaceieuropaei]
MPHPRQIKLPVDREVLKVTAEKPLENTEESSSTGQRFKVIEEDAFEEASSETEDDDSASEEVDDEFEELHLSRDSIQASKFGFNGDSEDFFPKLLARDSASDSFEKQPAFTPERQSTGSTAAQPLLSDPKPRAAPGQVPLPMEALPLTKSLEGLKAAAAAGDILAQWRFRRRMEGNQMSLLPLSGFYSQVAQQQPPGLAQPPTYPLRYANFPTVPPSYMPPQVQLLPQQPAPVSYACPSDVRTVAPSSMRSCGCNHFSSINAGSSTAAGPSPSPPSPAKNIVLREASVQYESPDLDQSSRRGPKTTSKSSETPKWMVERLLVKSVRSVAIQRGSEKGNHQAGSDSLSKNRTDAAVQCAEKSWDAEARKCDSTPPSRLPCLITQVVRQHVSYERSPAGNNASNAVCPNSPQRTPHCRPPSSANHADDSLTWPTPITSPVSSITPLKSSCDSVHSLDFNNAAVRKGPFGDWIHHRLSTAVDAPSNAAANDSDPAFSEDVILQQLKTARDSCARKLRSVLAVLLLTSCVLYSG